MMFTNKVMHKDVYAETLLFPIAVSCSAGYAWLISL